MNRLCNKLQAPAKQPMHTVGRFGFAPQRQQQQRRASLPQVLGARQVVEQRRQQRGGCAQGNQPRDPSLAGGQRAQQHDQPGQRAGIVELRLGRDEPR